MAISPDTRSAARRLPSGQPCFCPQDKRGKRANLSKNCPVTVEIWLSVLALSRITSREKLILLKTSFQWEDWTATQKYFAQHP